MSIRVSVQAVCLSIRASVQVVCLSIRVSVQVVCLSIRVSVQVVCLSRWCVCPSVCLSRRCQHNIFKTVTLQDINIDETRHVCSLLVCGQLLRSWILNFGPCATHGCAELSPFVNSKQAENIFTEKDAVRCRLWYTLNNGEFSRPVGRDDPSAWWWAVGETVALLVFLYWHFEVVF